MKFFIALQLLIYICFIGLDLTGNAIAASNLLKLTSISICLAFSIGQILKKRHKIAIIQMLILFFTLTSDYFLLLTDMFSMGISTFIIVQIGYGSLLKLANNEKQDRLGITFLTIVIIFTVILLFMNQTEGLSLLYAMLFIRNLVTAYKSKNQSEYSIWLFIGLVLYAICDVQVALFNLEFVKNQLPNLYAIATLGMWVFYLPGQVILTLSPRLYEVAKTIHQIHN